MAEIEVAEVVCGRCHTATFRSAKYCAECGHGLAESDQDLSTAMLAKQFAKGALGEVRTTAREVLASDLGKKMAAGAALGAAAATAIPFVGWATGAAFGAGFIAYKRLMK